MELRAGPFEPRSWVAFEAGGEPWRGLKAEAGGQAEFEADLCSFSAAFLGELGEAELRRDFAVPSKALSREC